MVAAGSPGTPHGARNMEAGVLLIALGALLLLISLFLDWYEPGADAWAVFEAWDLVLALLAIAALAAVAGRMGFGAPRPASWLIGSALGVLVIVLFALINPPPVVRAIDGDPDTGLWLALAAAALMAAGALLSVARISVALTPDTSGPAPPGAPGAPSAPGAPGASGTPGTEPTRRI